MSNQRPVKAISPFLKIEAPAAGERTIITRSPSRPILSAEKKFIVLRFLEHI